MILRRFNLNDIEKCKTIEDVFTMMGIGLKEDSPEDLNIRNEKVFGKRAYYANMIIHENTYNAIYEHLKPLSKKWYDKNHKRIPSPEALRWSDYSPISNGPRYEKVKEAVGDISEDVLYIITPDDSIYQEDPSLKAEEK